MILLKKTVKYFFLFSIFVFNLFKTTSCMQIVSGGADKVIRVWDVQKGKESAILRGHGKAVCSLSFSLNGKVLASGSADGRIRIWDIETGETKIIKGHRDGVGFVSLSPCGRMVASACGRSLDKTLIIWDVRSGRKLKNLTGHTKQITGVSFGPFGKKIASSSYDKTIRIWDVASGKCEKVLKGHTDWVTAVSFGPFGKKVVSGGVHPDHTVRVWDVASEKCESVLTGHSLGVSSVAFSPSGKKIVSSSFFGCSVIMWDVKDGEKCLVSSEEGPVSQVSFSPCGREIAFGLQKSTCGEVVIRDTRTGKLLQTLKAAYGFEINALVFGPVKVNKEKEARLEFLMKQGRGKIKELFYSAALQSNDSKK